MPFLTKLLMLVALAVSIPISSPWAFSAPPDAAIRQLDEDQRRMVASRDVSGLDRLAHASLRINAPGNRVLTREQFLANMRNGEIAAEMFERTPEEIAITGTVAVVMGRETFTPAATSELGRLYGAVPLSRRYTNIYVFEGGRWQWLARHANVLPPK
jgi:hypothetical protein